MQGCCSYYLILEHGVYLADEFAVAWLNVQSK